MHVCKPNYSAECPKSILAGLESEIKKFEIKLLTQMKLSLVSKMRPLTFFVFVLTLSSFDFLEATKVQLFKDENFRGLIYDHSFNEPECHNVQPYAAGFTGSIQTDTCLMVYASVNCGGESFRLTPGSTPEMASVRKNVNSYQTCNAQIGGDIIRVHMRDSGSNIIAKYEDVCSCMPLPSKVSTRLHSLTNFGNCLSVFSTDACSGESRDIPPGENSVSQNLPSLGYYIRSIRACSGHQACKRLSSEIQKFEVMSDETKNYQLFSTPKEVALATKTTFFNNGSATVYQEYEARKKIINSVTFEKSKTIMSMKSQEHSSGWNIGVSLGLRDTASSASISASVGVALMNAYGSQDTEEETNGESVTHTEEKEFAAKQIIEVPPCVEYEVQGVLETLEDYPLVYEVYTKLSGESSGTQMTVEEIRPLVSDMTMEEVIDEHNAIFKSRHVMQVSVGVETKVSGEGKEIPYCRQSKLKNLRKRPRP